jgi:hypothetical protein
MLQPPWGTEELLPTVLSSTPWADSSWGSRSRRKATGEITTSGESLTLVVIGSDDLGLLRMLLLCHVSYLRKTERTAMTGTTVELSPGRTGSCVRLQEKQTGRARVYP